MLLKTGDYKVRVGSFSVCVAGFCKPLGFALQPHRQLGQKERWRKKTGKGSLTKQATDTAEEGEGETSSRISQPRGFFLGNTVAGADSRLESTEPLLANSGSNPGVAPRPSHPVPGWASSTTTRKKPNGYRAFRCYNVTELQAGNKSL